MSFAAEIPTLIVRARELPKGAEVEGQMNLHTGRRASRDQLIGADDGVAGDNADSTAVDKHEDEDEGDDEDLQPEYGQGSDRATSTRWETYRVADAAGRKARRGSRAVVFLSRGE